MTQPDDSISSIFKYPRQTWSESILEMIYEIQSKKGALNSPAIGDETIAAIRQWVRIENSLSTWI